MVPMGWNDAVLVAKKLIPNSNIKRVVMPKVLAANAKSSLPMVRVEIQTDAGPQFKTLLYGESFNYSLNNKSKQLACHQLSSPASRITMLTQIVCFGEVKASNMSLFRINDSKIRDVKCLAVIIKNQWGKLMGHILVKRCESLE